MTDHFVAIYGCESDIRGKIIDLLAKDNAVSNTAEIRFNVNVDGSITKPVEKRAKGQEYINQAALRGQV